MDLGGGAKDTDQIDADGVTPDAPVTSDDDEKCISTRKCSTKCQEGKPEDFFEDVVCQESDLVENQMEGFEFGDSEVLVVKQKGNIYAIGNKCTHAGAPLNSGALGIGRVRCPWHGACFNLATGDIEDYPGLDSLPCMKVKVDKNGGVKVKGLRKDVDSGFKSLCKEAMKFIPEKDGRTFVIVGGGPSSQVCAEILRQHGFHGKLIMIAKEPCLPYDRTKLSKQLDVSAENIALRSKEFYKKSHIDLKIGTELLSVDTSTKQLTISSGEKIKYDFLYLATGSSARTLSIPGSNLQKIFYLRELEDANKIAKEVNSATNVLIIGASFIGVESASWCISKAKSVTVVGLESVPFQASLGPQVGEQIKKLFESKGVKFCMDATVEEILPSNADPSAVGQVKLGNGEILDADVIIAGVGAKPNTDFLQGSELKVNQRGLIKVNEFLETGVDGIFAGGDIAEAPVLGQSASIAHWQLAHYHGRIAGFNMLGKKVPLNAVPFFWTRFFDMSIQYSGHAFHFDDVIVKGDLGNMSFVAYYCNGNSVMAVASCSTDQPIASCFAELLSSGKSLSKSEVGDDPTPWIKSITA